MTVRGAQVKYYEKIKNGRNLTARGAYLYACGARWYRHGRSRIEQRDAVRPVRALPGGRPGACRLSRHSQAVLLLCLLRHMAGPKAATPRTVAAASDELAGRGRLLGLVV